MLGPAGCDWYPRGEFRIKVRTLEYEAACGQSAGQESNRWDPAEKGRLLMLSTGTMLLGYKSSLCSLASLRPWPAGYERLVA